MSVTELAHVEKTKDAGQLAKVLGSFPFFREQSAKLRAEILKGRRELAAQLETARAGRETKEFRTLVSKSEAARQQFADAQATAKRTVEEARQRLQSAMSVLQSFDYGNELTVRKIESELVTTADPRISEFIEWAFAEHNRTNNSGGRTGPGQFKTNPVTLKREPVTSGEPLDTGSPAPSPVRTRMDALLNAISQAEALRLVPDPDVEAELEKIKAAIPDAGL